MQTVAYLGPEHTNTHLAAQRKFGAGCRYVHAPTVEDVFQLVERRRVDYGVVPVENSLEGAVAHTLDRFIDFMDTPVKIHGEVEQPIRHHLIVHRGVSLARIADVYSHPQALAQCHRWLNDHLPRAERHETNSTADAVWDVLNDRKLKRCAAIGRGELAKEHDLQAMPIPEERENKTRFLIIGLGDAARGRVNKTSVVFALKDRPGALHDALVPFKMHRINLTKIESRPSKRKAWEYLFFIDLEGHQDDTRAARALRALAKQTTLFRVLGSYPISKR
jgi:chorismate mutase/prephenate dehydratase